jgi:pyruvate/2-oxoacid:ferredoxin oxidoreductase beta subunit
MVDIDSNTQAYEDQAAAIKSAIETYGTDHINGVSTCINYLSIEMDI